MALYEHLSPIYGWLTASEAPLRDRALGLLAAQAGERIAEIGCGPGQALGELAAAVGAKGQAIGLDYAQGMVGEARRRLGGRDAALLRGDGRRLPLASGSCDAVFLSFTLELFNLEDQHRLLGEIRRVLREAGRLGLVSLSTHQETRMLRVYQLLNEFFPAIIDCRPMAVAPLLAAAGFDVLEEEQALLYGLPVTIILARAS